MRNTLTPDDLKRGELAEPGWHPMEIVNYEEKEAGTDQSTNCIFNFKIIDGKDKGKTANKLFNEKALGFGKALWVLVIPGFDKVKGGDLSTEAFKAAVGSKMLGYIKRGKSNKGNEFNDITDFRPLA